jgi:hypothetical protein
MTRDTKIRLALAVMVFMMVQAVFFGFGMMALQPEPNRRVRFFLDTGYDSGELHYFRCRLLVDRPASARPLLAV